ncbi:MAG: hypothetical protein Q8M66_06025 [Actinomycetota bacterium]|jgi:hypothetical protein|nr:hypothetical protein [Actinomycetota bacterium]MDZ4178435.1 hypothetical protein [Coriobacteriia bacterium]
MRHEPDIEASRDVHEAFGRVVQDMTPLERARVRERVMSRIAVAARPTHAPRPFALRTAAAAAAFLILTLGSSYAVAMSAPGTLLHPVKTAFVRLVAPSDPAVQPDMPPAGDSDSGKTYQTPEAARPSLGDRNRAAAARNRAETGELRREIARLRTRDHTPAASDEYPGRSAGTLKDRTPATAGVDGNRKRPETSGDAPGSGGIGNQGDMPGNGSGPEQVEGQNGQRKDSGESTESTDSRRRSGK